MKIRTTVVVDPEDGTPPTKHEIWQDLPDAEVREFQFPGRAPIGPFEMFEYERQIDRHKRYVQMLATNISTALGRALGDKPE